MTEKRLLRVLVHRYWNEDPALADLVAPEEEIVFTTVDPANISSVSPEPDVNGQPSCSLHMKCGRVMVLDAPFGAMELAWSESIGATIWAAYPEPA